MADKRTSPKVAREAAQVLRSPLATPEERSAAGSALSQAAAQARETSARVASEAGRVLGDANTSAAERAAAATVLSQRAKK
jgi:hypothetical protein